MTLIHGHDHPTQKLGETAPRGMDISVAAFGNFDPQLDPDAAAKFALSAIGRGTGRQFLSLAQLLTEGAPIGEVEGEPGWTLERRDNGNNMPGYARWPAGAKYRAYVDPAQYRLATPEKFYDRANFHALVLRLMTAFETLHPDRRDATISVRAIL